MFLFGAGPNFPARGEGPDADQEDFALREWLRCSFEMCMSDRDREVVGEAARDRERIRPVDGGGGRGRCMQEWDCIDRHLIRNSLTCIAPDLESCRPVLSIVRCERPASISQTQT